ncbi:phage holin [Mesobacillus zeae]|uniref:PTS mannose transporter subunit IID n=1 Tax=Mesobacillus zeae TaxID=1917180 RepID=A0A398AUN0_9BACI|nr:phage holin [Mesobacillus zeae]RID81425.1 PTS mannose transporter subunit IID [Mesobacillus zeae]
MKKDIFTLLGGFLSAVFFFRINRVSVEWFTQISIEAFVFMISAGAALAINLFAIWKNTYVSKKAKDQKDFLNAITNFKQSSGTAFYFMAL